MLCVDICILFHSVVCGKREISRSFCFSRATEKILYKARQTVDVKKDDGFAALHLAALNGHREVASTLISVVGCTS